MNYHSQYLSAIKRGVKASYVAYERVKDVYYLKVIKNKETKFFELDGTPEDVTPEKYEKLYQQLLSNGTL